MAEAVGGWTVVLALLNRGSSAGTLRFTAGEIGMLDTPKLVRDLWKQEDAADFTGEFSREVLPHSTVLLKINRRWKAEKRDFLLKIRRDPHSKSYYRLSCNIARICSPVSGVSPTLPAWRSTITGKLAESMPQSDRRMRIPKEANKS